jgi:hypothetical protein
MPTPEERAYRILPSSNRAELAVTAKIRADIVDAILAAVAEAREEAAKVAESMVPRPDELWEARIHAGRACRDIAAAIRSLP